MKKKLLTMLLCVTMISSILCACGNKETEPQKSTEVEEQKEEVESEVEEVKDNTSEEVVEETKDDKPEEVVEETPEPMEEEIEEPKEEINANLDIVVEVPQEIQQAKDVQMPIGVETTMDFGILTRLGDNEDYPNALENVEIHYLDKVFQVALPKDMCVSFKFDKEAQQLNIYNIDQSKRVWFFFTDMTLREDEKIAMSDEDFKSYITKRVEKPLDNAKVKTLVETKDVVVQSVPSQTSPWIGEFVLYSTFNNEPFEKENENNEMVMHDSGCEYSFLYGDTDTSASPELASYIAESFKIIE